MWSVRNRERARVYPRIGWQHDLQELKDSAYPGNNGVHLGDQSMREKSGHTGRSGRLKRRTVNTAWVVLDIHIPFVWYRCSLIVLCGGVSAS